MTEDADGPIVPTLARERVMSSIMLGRSANAVLIAADERFGVDDVGDAVKGVFHRNAAGCKRPGRTTPDRRRRRNRRPAKAARWGEAGRPPAAWATRQ